MSINKIQYKQSGKYFEFWLDGELKERATEISTLMQKVKKLELSISMIVLLWMLQEFPRVRDIRAL